jgi:hypothetical protein
MSSHALRALVAGALVTLGACGPPLSPLPPPPTGIGRIAVEEPANKTGDKLQMDERGALALVLGPKHTTVSEVLAADLRKVLAKQRFDVVAPRGAAPILRIELGRWEAYAADYSMVTVDLKAKVVEPGTARELWSASRKGWIVRTPDAGSRPEAYVAASRAVAEGLLEGWRPGKPPAKTTSIPDTEAAPAK